MRLTPASILGGLGLSLSVGSAIASCPPADIFAPSTNFPSGVSSFGLDAADLDNDGDLDIVIAGLDNRVSILFNDGSGFFGAPVVFNASGNRPEAVDTGDLDGDGDLDLLVTLTSAASVAVHLNDGTGAFSSGQNFTVGNVPREATLADMNGDGNLDVVTAYRNTGNNGRVAVLLGNGDGTFGSPITAPVGVEPLGVAVADFDGDGDLDAAVSYLGEVFQGGVRVFVNNGSGSLSSSQNLGGDSAFRVAAADLDNDGDPDLAASYDNTEDIRVFINDGSGTFATQPTYPAGDRPIGVAIGDLDGDGDNDLTTVTRNDRRLRIFPNNSNGTFGARADEPLSNPFGENAVIFADIDNDGDLDAIATSNGVINGVDVFENICGPFAPIIAEQPANLAVETGDPAELRVGVAQPTPDTTFAWRRDGIVLTDGDGISGTDTTTLTIAAADAGDAGVYDVVVTNAQGSATSASAVVAVRAGCEADLAPPFGQLDFFDVQRFLQSFSDGCP